jgi:hypothetical protein
MVSSIIPVAVTKSKNHHAASPQQQLCTISNGQQQQRIGKFLPEQALPDPRMHQIINDGPPPPHMFIPNQYNRGDTIGQMLMPQSPPSGDQDWHRMRHEYEMSKTMHHQQTMMSTKGPRMMHPNQLHDQHQQRFMHPDEMHYRNAVASRVPSGYCMPPQQQQWSRMMQPGYSVGQPDQSTESMMMMNGGSDMYGPPPTVNTYHVNATIQQMNIQNVGAPMMHSTGPSMNVQQMNVEQQHQQTRYRPAGVPPMHHHPGQPTDPNTMGAVYDCKCSIISETR